MAVIEIILFIARTNALVLLLLAMLFPNAIEGRQLQENALSGGQAQVEMAYSGPVRLPEGPRVSDDFFNDTLFVGDSVTRKLELYALKQRKTDPELLGNARFYAAASLGSGNLQKPISNKSVHPKVNGTKMLVEDAVAACEAKKVYIMLGMNDIAVYDIQGSVDNMMALIGKVREKSPGVEVYVQSVTPRILGKDQKTLNNRNIVRYNQLLCDTIEASGLRHVWFVDVASVLRGEDGTLPRAYCSDPGDQGIHFTDAACKIWIDYLYTHTPQAGPKSAL
jgi:hypothetical protein